MKVRAYADNWGDADLLCEDVNSVRTTDLPATADLVWGSFPCQDLSLAGDYHGLGERDSGITTRSGSFWPFWRLMEELAKEGRAPTLVILENVLGILSSNGGRDFAAIAEVLAQSGYRFGAVVMDAKWFLPQSRPRVFVIAVRDGTAVPRQLLSAGPDDRLAPPMLRAAHSQLSRKASDSWIWWNVPASTVTPKRFSELLESDPKDVRWHSDAQTNKLLDSMSSTNRLKVEAAKKAGRRMVGTVYRRTRPNGDGTRSVRAEVRFDDVAGCLRTPSGGSSRQKLLIVDGQTIKSRLLSGREAARLMGLRDSYRLPERYNDAYHIAGDGVAVPVVSHLARTIFEPLLLSKNMATSIAAE